MPNYYYFDANGQKYGLVNDQQLQALVAQGVITPSTPLETEGGHKGTAGQIPGLRFNTAPPPSFAQPAQTTSYSRETSSYSQAGGSGGQFLSMFDFTFRDVRLPSNGRAICTVIYIVYCIWAIICGLGLTVIIDVFWNATTFTFSILYWLSLLVSVFLVRLLCEWQIVLLDWIAENKKASRIYSKNNGGD